MKKLMAIVLMLSVLLSTVAIAEDLGIQVIGDQNTGSLTLDDIQLGQTYSLDDYARVIPVEFQIVDYFAQFNKDADRYAVDDYNKDSSKVYYEEKALKGDWAYAYKQAIWQDSGSSADFMWLKLDVINRQKTPISFMEDITVKVIYADDYEFAGWVRQINYDYNEICYRYGMQTAGGKTVVLNPANEQEIGMMYTGTYVIGCTLPNTVVEDKSSPLRIEIMLGSHQLTYHIRK